METTTALNPDPLPGPRPRRSEAPGFPLSRLSLICCPRDGGWLRADDGGAGPIRRGSVSCQQCGARYQIEDGILDLLAQQPVLDETMRDEIAARDRQAPVYDTLFADLGDQMEIPSILRSLEPRPGMTLLELGAGTGRVTAHLLASSTTLVAVDFSRASLLELARRAPGAHGLALVLADATRLRLPERAFDRVVSSQVIAHIPSLASRHALYATANAALKPDGRFVCTAYHFGLSRWADEREGFHQSRIYFRRFTVEDLRHELGSQLRVLEVRPICIQVPLLGRLGLPAVWLSQQLERLPLLRRLGDLLLATAGKS